MAKRPKRPRDPNVLAKLIVDIATGDVREPPPAPVNEARRRGGLKGGKARARKVTAAKRRAIGKKGARARWSH